MMTYMYVPAPPPEPPSEGPGLPLRWVVILLIAVLTATAATVLTYLGGTPLPLALLAGGAAFGGAVDVARSSVG